MDIVSLLILRALSGGGGGGDIPVARQIDYDNSTSGLDAENVQNAIDEVVAEKINSSEKGSAGGVAELNENGFILTSQLPSYVDDVLEFPTLNDFPEQGESGKIYVDLFTNRTYRWGGSGYTEISPSLALGETASTAYRGDRGKTAYDHSQIKTGNPHNVTKAQIGLENVDNTSDANKPISTATQAALDTKLSEDDLYNMTENSTVSGNPVTLKTLAKTNAKSAKVTLLPIQDLHGYDSPWVGGAGKNKYPIKIGRDSFNDNVGGTHSTDNDTLTVVMPSAGNSGVYSRGIAELTKLIGKYNETITYSFDVKSNVGGNINVGYEGYGFKTVTLTTAWQRISITTTATSIEKSFLIYNASGVAQTVEVKDFMFELGSTAHNYEPYSNICPITGRNSVKLVRTGVNRFNYNSYDSIDISGGGAMRNGHIFDSGSYTIINNSTSNDFYYRYVKKDYSSYGSGIQVNSGVSVNVTANSDSYLYAYSSTTPSNVFVGLGTNLAYEPYQGLTVIIQLGQTVYGGNVNVTDGGTDSTYGMVDFGTLSWAQGNVGTDSAHFYSNALDNFNYISDTAINYISSNYKSISVSQRYQNGTVFINSGNRVVVKDDNYTDVQTFKTAMSGVQLCYELATPTELTTSAEQISLLKGNNVVSTDGDNIEVVYEELDLTELPDVTSADEGKVLTVNSSGEWVAQTLPDGTNISY